MDRSVQAERLSIARSKTVESQQTTFALPRVQAHHTKTHRVEGQTFQALGKPELGSGVR